MVRPTEAAVAVTTFERFLSGMFAIMPRELVRPREPPRAALPRASVRLFARVRALVRLEMRALRVDLSAALVVALVDALASVVDLRTPHPQPVVALRTRSREMRKWVYCSDHTETATALQLRARNIS